MESLTARLLTSALAMSLGLAPVWAQSAPALVSGPACLRSTAMGGNRS